MKKSITLLFAILIAVNSFAEDLIYLANGNMLVPTIPTDIKVKKEILSITLTDRGYTDIDVYYELFNPETATMFEVGFEAKAPVNAGVDLKLKSTEDSHPFIQDFTVMVNGTKTPHKTAIILNNSLKKVKALPDENTPYSYGYFAAVAFKPGLNQVRHTYKFRNSFGEHNTFYIPYIITTATRWADKSVEEFTLVINSATSAKHFCINNKPFSSTDYHIVGRDGKTRQAKYAGEEVTEICLRNAATILQIKDFKPTADIEIYSADCLHSDDVEKIMTSGEFYDRSIPDYQSYSNLSTTEKKIMKSLPYANRGQVFEDKEIADFFKKIWWYMPNPDWEKTTKGFTIDEKKMISTLSK